jgi:hypothetical protein
MRQYTGGCLCGNLRYVVEGRPTFPHLCSCRMCQKWSGAPTVAWVEFPLGSIEWIGSNGAPNLYRSSEKSQRGFCSRCGGTVCVLDDGYDKISLTIATLDDPSAVVPGTQHSYRESAPTWWKVRVAPGRSKRAPGVHTV